MTNTKMLEKAIQDCGLKKRFIAEKLGVSRSGLVNLINNRAEFRAKQILTLCNLLHLTEAQRDQIFFADKGV